MSGLNKEKFAEHVLREAKSLALLQQTQPTCFTCCNKSFDKVFCIKYSAEIPLDFANSTQCPDWEFDDIPW